MDVLRAYRHRKDMSISERDMQTWMEGMFVQVGGLRSQSERMREKFLVLSRIILEDSDGIVQT
eukprot:2489762-Rhodomonas_salina.2